MKLIYCLDLATMPNDSDSEDMDSGEMNIDSESGDPNYDPQDDAVSPSHRRTLTMEQKKAADDF